MDTRTLLQQNLRSLRMPGIAEMLDVRLKEAQENRLGYLDFLSLVIQDERMQRDNNQIQKLIRSAGFGLEKTLEGFDKNFNAAEISPAVVNEMSTLSFMDKGRNVVIAGPPGIGKTHIAKAVGHEACRRKKHVVFRNIYTMFSELAKARTHIHYERQFKKLVGADLLILDDFGLRKFAQNEVDILYSVVDARQGLTSIIMTSNRPPEDWLGAFPDPVVGGAILDRLVSGAVKLLVTSAKSYRKEGRR